MVGRRTRMAIAAALLAGGAWAPTGGQAGANPPPPDDGVTTNCAVRARGANPVSIGKVSVQAKPDAERPDGTGAVSIVLPDGGGHLVAQVDFLLCRRDGGAVPAHGGANIADVRGPGKLVVPRARPLAVEVHVHLEDRGTDITEDYISWLATVDGPDGPVAVASGGNYLATGDVRLVRV